MRACLLRKLILSVVILLHCMQSAEAYITPFFDPHSLLRDCDVASKVEITELHQIGVVPRQLSFDPPFVDSPRMLATARVLRPIKGVTTETITIEFCDEVVLSGSRRNFTTLGSGEVCIVFLEHREGEPYRFKQPFNGKLKVSRTSSAIKLGENVFGVNTLLEELATTAHDAATSMALRLDALFWLGGLVPAQRETIWKNGWASLAPLQSQLAPLLEALRTSNDPHLRAMATCVSLQLRIAPSVADCMAIYQAEPPLRWQPCHANTDAWNANPDMRKLFLDGAERSFMLTVPDMHDRTPPMKGSSWIESFDYAQLCNQLLELESVKQDPGLTKRIQSLLDGESVIGEENLRND